jgi:hypothetical protein
VKVGHMTDSSDLWLPVDRRERGLSYALMAALAGLVLWQTWPAIGPESLWLDDTWSALAIRADDLGELALVVFASPGHSFAMWALAQLDGPIELTAQIPALTAAILLAPLGFLVTWWKSRDLAAAAVTGLILAVSPQIIELAARAKHYTMDALLSLGLLAIFLWAADGQQPQRRSWAVVAGCVVAFAASVGTAPACLAVFVAVLIEPITRRDWAQVRGWLSKGAIAGALAVVWFLLVVEPRVTAEARSYWSFAYLPLTDPTVALERLGAGVASIARSLSSLPVWLVLGGLLASAVAVTRRLPAWAIATFGPVLATALMASLDLVPFGGGRTDTVLLPGLAVGVGLAVSLIPLRLRAWVVGAIVVILAVGGVTKADYPTGDVRHAVEKTASTRGPGETILVHIGAWYGYALYTPQDIELIPVQHDNKGFWFSTEDEKVFFVDNPALLPIDHVGRLTTFEEAIGDTSRVWLVGSHLRSGAVEVKFDEIEEYLGARGFERVETRPFTAAEVRVFDRS